MCKIKNRFVNKGIEFKFYSVYLRINVLFLLFFLEIWNDLVHVINSIKLFVVPYLIIAN